ncbi:C-type lectin BfL-2-like [Neocloeon triangulifer]|uniref:C-type lectin BfL-2-like n=1 Tax=Neocloeon triangulifer TaxID=2078957 RepID=UPI00286F4ECD|nr:C-type lectin BfL-2-like [Neocloeon triangulifer]
MKHLSVFVVALYAVFAISNVASLSDEWTTFKEGQYIMKILSGPATWLDAVKQCREQGYELLTVESQAEEDEVLAVFGPYITNRLWLGGTDLGKEGSFYWYSTGAPLNFTAWHAGEPSGNNPSNGVKEDCLQYQNKNGVILWNDSVCENEYNFICELYDPCARRPF